MAFTPIPNGVRIVHVGRFGNVDVINTFGAQNGDVAGGSSLKDLAKTHGDAWRQFIVPPLVNKYSHVTTLAYSLEDQSFPVGDAGYTSPVTGAGVGTPLPLNVCMVISTKTDKRGRTYEGRSFLSGLATDLIGTDGVSWSAAGVALMQGRFNSYKGAVDPAIGHNGRLAVCSKGSVLHGIDPHVEPVTSLLARPYIGTQRRRLS